MTLKSSIEKHSQFSGEIHFTCSLLFCAGGVHWLTVGKLSDHRGDVDRAQVLSKLQQLILRLDKSNSNRQLQSADAANDYLQKVCRHGRSL